MEYRQNWTNFGVNVGIHIPAPWGVRIWEWSALGRRSEVIAILYQDKADAIGVGLGVVMMATQHL